MELHPTTLFPELEREHHSSHKTGVFPYQLIKGFVEAGKIRSSEPILESQIQPASLDLRLGPIGYQLRASFLPGKKSTVVDKLQGLVIQELDLTKPCVLQRGGVYLIPLLEEVYFSNGIFGKANPKSTTGRIDVFTRIITDHADEFERIGHGYKGKLYCSSKSRQPP